jgi:hypothetical protein
MFEKLIDTIVLLIAALQENTAARNAEAGVVRTNVQVPTPTAETTPPKPPRNKKDTPPPPPAETAAVAPSFMEAPEAKKPPMPLEAANAALVAEWKRLGENPEAMAKINAVLASYGVPSLTTLPEDKRAECVEKVKALV